MHALTNWLKIFRRSGQMMFMLLLPCFSFAQLMTLEKAYALARDNYPLIRQKQLIRQTAALNVSNISKRFMPQLSFNGQASYQSEVTSIKVPIPGFDIVAPDKDQYRITADVSQLIYDGGLSVAQKQQQQLNAAVEDQQVELELYQLKERISQVYLSILYLDEQLKQAELVKQDIGTGIKKVEAQVQNGVAFRSNLNTMQAESVRADQRIIELRAARKAMVETLGLFTGQSFDENSQFERPVPEPAIVSPPAVRSTQPQSAVTDGNSSRLSAVAGSSMGRIMDINNPLLISRPEIKLFSDQALLLDQQEKMIRIKSLPKTSLFFQGGYGRPGLNLLKNDFDLFYITGIRFNWSLEGLYTSKNERQLVQVGRQMIDTRRETFLLNTNTQLSQQQADIDKLGQLIASDTTIIGLRRMVKDAAKAQLENGVISANDYLREVNAEDLSRQNLITHQIQLLQARINYQIITGK